MDFFFTPLWRGVSMCRLLNGMILGSWAGFSQCVQLWVLVLSVDSVLLFQYLKFLCGSLVPFTSQSAISAMNTWFNVGCCIKHLCRLVCVSWAVSTVALRYSSSPAVDSCSFPLLAIPDPLLFVLHFKHHFLKGVPRPSLRFKDLRGWCVCPLLL
jgi:hypothetical protein